MTKKCYFFLVDGIFFLLHFRPFSFYGAVYPKVGKYFTVNLEMTRVNNYYLFVC